MIATPETLAIDVADARALKLRAGSGDRTALREAARQFESLMVAQMIKAMRQTRFSEEDDPLTGGESFKLYQGLLDQQWAARLSAGRGLGFAESLVRHLERQAGLPPPAEATAAGKAAGHAADAVAGSSAAAGVAPRAHLPVLPAAAPPADRQPPLPVVQGAGAERKQAFLETLRPHAEAAEQATGVPAGFMLAQAALESGWGSREIRDGAGRQSFNLFGVKAGRGWSGETVDATTTEYRQGLPVKQSQRFRAYADYAAAFADYANLLKRRYGEALSTDADAFAQGLANGGYATDPAYAGKLKAVIASVATAGV